MSVGGVGIRSSSRRKVKEKTRIVTTSYTMKEGDRNDARHGSVDVM